MGVACNKCGSRNTEVVKASDLANATGDSQFLTNASGVTKVSPDVLIGLAIAIISLIKSIFDWLTESEKKIIVCKNCGYWERV